MFWKQADHWADLGPFAWNRVLLVQEVIQEDLGGGADAGQMDLLVVP